MSRVLNGLLVSMVVACPALADAQSAGPAGTPRALFGADTRDPDRAQKADASMSLTFTDDSRNQLMSRLQGERLDSWMLRNGRFAALDGTLQYQKKTRRWTIGAATTSTLQYAAQAAGAATDHSANVAINMSLGRRTTFSATERVLYAPQYRADGLLLQSRTSEAAGTSTPTGAYSSATNLGVSQRLSRASTVAFHYDVENVSFAGSGGDLRTWGAGARLYRRLTRSAALQLGYGQRVGRYSGTAADRTVRIHDLELGIEYRRSVSRLMTLTFVPGSSIVATTRGHDFRPSGEILLNRRIGRAWHARAGYRRKAELIEGVDAPFFVDAVTGQVLGSVGRRIDVTASAAYSASQIASSGGASFDSESVSARASFAMSRHWALFGEYQYYSHRGSATIALAGVGVPGGHSARMGLRWWRPLR